LRIHVAAKSHSLVLCVAGYTVYIKLDN